MCGSVGHRRFASMRRLRHRLARRREIRGMRRWERCGGWYHRLERGGGLCGAVWRDENCVLGCDSGGVVLSGMNGRVESGLCRGMSCF